MQDLLRFIPALVDQLGDNQVAREAFVFAAWKKVAGEGLRGKTAPVALDGETLVVAVRDATWKRNLESLAGQMIFKVNSAFRRQFVTFIEFRIDEKAVDEESSIAETATSQEQFRADAALEITDEVRSAAEAIKDAGLREQFLSAAGECLARKKRMGY